MTHRVAAIDCGTNSIRLLIADIRPEKTDTERSRVSPDTATPTLPPLTDLVREMRIVRLGEGVDKTGRLSAAALDRTMAALGEYADLIKAAAPEAVRMVATSATRDAGNAREFTERVTAVLGIAPEVVTGDEEAWLSFTGATRELAGLPLAAQHACPPPYLVTDIGGGSTEFALLARGGEPPVVPPAWGSPSPISPSPEASPPGTAPSVPFLLARGGEPPVVPPAWGSPSPRAPVVGVSVDIGCVRLTERHLHGDPPAAAEIAATAADIDAALELAEAGVPVRQARTLVGLAGSVTTIAAIALGLDGYDSARIHHSRLSAPAVHQIAGDLLAMSRAQRAAIPAMHPGRVDVIGGGALILDAIMTRFGFAEVLVSEHDILDGIAWSLVP